MPFRTGERRCVMEIKLLGKRTLPLFKLSLFVLLLCGCNLGIKGGCGPDGLVSPGLVSPASGALVDSLSPAMTWEYTTACRPDSFRIEMYAPARSTFRDESLRTTRFDAGEVPWGTTSWTSSIGLQPASTYSWRVAGIMDFTTGPYSPDSWFVTGPVCGESGISTLLAPTLVSPPDGTVITEPSSLGSGGVRFPTPIFYLIWDDPSTCLPPDGYTVQVSADPSFGSHGTLSFDATYVTTGLFFFPPGSGWTDCTRYYWRVGQNKTGWGSGPFSDTWSFFVNTTGAEICTTFRPTFFPHTTPFGLDHPLIPTETLTAASPTSTGTTTAKPTLTQTDRPTSTPTSPPQPTKTFTPQLPPTHTPTVKFQQPPLHINGCWVRQKDQSLKCTAPCPQNAVPGGACTP
jgi:hypothetical protein